MNVGNQLSQPVVPEDFTKPSSSYRLKAWLAMLGLLIFGVIYVGLASWFTYTSYRMISGVFVGGDGAAAGFFAALPSAFLAIFMWKALFFIRQGAVDPGVEITKDDQPELFDFLYELADELRAPRPHRVFLSPEVNACVFYDLTILNFILPSKKNLVIGLGLVNVLTRSEFKAVLAHEFGHFAQRSMAVGRWVYIGEQIAGHIIASRGMLDKVLDFISTIDLRIAWIGWIMRLIVWSIRSLMESVFNLVILAQRALSREMEFQADLVAVSATGSDALIHGLYRLQPADDDWEQCLDFANTQLGKGRQVIDLFLVQTQIGEHMQRILNDFTTRQVPEIPGTDPASHRVFTEQIAQPPRMWSTHPPNTEREENAKKIYVPMRLDNEPAWSFFQRPEEAREAVTQFLFERAELKEPPEAMPTSEALTSLDEKFSHESFNPSYQGVYLGRLPTLSAENASLISDSPSSVENIAASLDELYPSELHEEVTQWRNLRDEVAMLEAVESGVLESPAGGLRHRGRTIRHSHLPGVIASVKHEQDDALSRIERHDKLCRTVHQAAAQKLEAGWPDYLKTLAELLHYLEHSLANLNDAHSHLANTTAVAVATGRVSQKKLNRLLDSGRDLRQVMGGIDSNAEHVSVPQPILTKLEWTSWRETLDEIELPAPDEHNINDWMNVIESWVGPMRADLNTLRQAVLAELLRSEKRVASMYHGDEDCVDAPGRADVPESYSTRPPGTERKQQKTLDWWSRFTLADGTGPATLRFCASSSIVAAVVVAGMFVGNATIAIYNGLSIPVSVLVNERQIIVQPHGHRSLSVGATITGTIESSTEDGRLIESFEATLDKGFATYVYNVASAAPMIEWTAVYGNAHQPDPETLGFPRWRTTRADHVFEEPPAQIKISGSGGSRSVLSSYSDLTPQQILSFVADPSEINSVILAHAEWDAANSKFAGHWLTMGTKLPNFAGVVARRLAANPDEVLSLRLQQDTAEPTEKNSVLERHRQLAAQHPDSSDWQYIGVRAMPDGPKQDQAFVDGFAKWSDNEWFANAAGNSQARRGSWQESLAAYDVVLKNHGPVASHAAIQVARIRRFLAGDVSVDLSDLSGLTDLDSILMVETGDQELRGTEVFAFYEMANGKLTEAYNTAGAENANSRLLSFLAASEGAEAEWQKRALQLPVAEIEDSAQAIILAALAARLKQPHMTYLDRYSEITEKQAQPTQKTVADFVAQFIDQAPQESLENNLPGLGPAERGLVLAAAVVIHPLAAPPHWRKLVKQLLFAVERPYFAVE